MFLGMKSKQKLCISINYIKIKSSSEVNLLGITIDNKLIFDNHITKICKKRNQTRKKLVNTYSKPPYCIESFYKMITAYLHFALSINMDIFL